MYNTLCGSNEDTCFFNNWFALALSGPSQYTIYGHIFAASRKLSMDNEGHESSRALKVQDAAVLPYERREGDVAMGHTKLP